MELHNLLSIYNVLNTRFSLEDRNLAVIKSNLMRKCTLLAEEENCSLDTKSICCQWCFNTLSPQTCSVELKPLKHPKKHLRSLLKKDDESLNRFQKKLVGKLRNKPMSNTMAFKCKLCSRTTLNSLRKPIIERKIEVVEVNVSEDVGKKKKKKKKDVYAGLKAAAVLSMKNNSVNVNNQNVNIPAKTKAKTLSIKEQSRMQRVLSQAPVVNKKPSLLAAFLDNM